MNLNFFKYVVFSFALLACHKKETPHLFGPSHYGINSPDLLKFKFKAGTYWVYNDSITSMRDSSYVINPREYTIQYNGNSYDTYTFQVQRCCGPDSTIENYQIAQSSIMKNPQNVETGDRIYLPFNETNNSLGFTYFDSVFIYDRYYKNVEKAIIDKDYSEGNKKVIYYINSDYGFLRKDIFNSGNSLISKKLLIKKNIVR